MKLTHTEELDYDASSNHFVIKKINEKSLMIFQKIASFLLRYF